MRKTLAPLCLVLPFLIAGCSKPTVFPLVRQAGRYELRPTNCTLTVEVKDHIVWITILDAAGHQLASNHLGNDYQKWGLFWDEPNKQLWYDSRDVGITVWTVSGTAAVEQDVTPGTKDLGNKEPAALVTELPN